MTPLICLGWDWNAFSVVKMGSESKKFKESSDLGYWFLWIWVFSFCFLFFCLFSMLK